MNDLRFAFRQLAKNPGFTLVVVLTLALGIGANTAMFSIINAVLIRPPPFPESRRLVFISEATKESGRVSISYPDFLDWQKQQNVFSSLAAYRENGWNLTGTAEPEKVTGLQVSASFFPALRATPVYGRSFTAEEDSVGGAQVVVLSEGLWRRRFNADPGILNRTITLDGKAWIVIGIMPATFQFPRRVELWTPIGHQAPWTDRRGWHPDIYAIGRLKPGVELSAARAGLETVAARLATEHPNTNTSLGVEIIPLQEMFAGSGVRTALNLLFGAVIFVLLIACMNITHLLLARGAQRQHEIGVRVALGARRWHLLRHLMTESLLLAALGGVAGLLMASWSLDALRQLLPPELNDVVSVKIDSSVLLFSVGAAILTGLLFGVAPAWQVARKDAVSALREGGCRESPGWGRSWGRRGLIVGEVALALMLLVGAGLLLRSFGRLQAVPLGIEPENVLTMEIGLPGYKYPDGRQQAAFYRRAIEAIRVLPGVESAGFVAPLPISARWTSDLYIEHELPSPGQRVPLTDFTFVTSDYFKTLGITLLKGRSFADTDDGRYRVCIVDETLEKIHFGGAAIGKRMAIGGTNWMTVVGVVRHVRDNRVGRDSGCETYLPISQEGIGWMVLAVKTKVLPASLAQPVRKAIQSLDPHQPVTNLLTLEEILARNLSDRRLAVVLLGLFAALALALAGVGLYGVMAFNVASRTREIGIRMALGAKVADVLSLILRQGGTLVALGVLIGLFGAWALTRLMTSLLFQTAAVDPATYLAAPLLLGVVAFAACWFPAWRAARVDPIQALRVE